VGALDEPRGPRDRRLLRCDQLQRDVLAADAPITRET
jgi:hypothetical protein